MLLCPLGLHQKDKQQLNCTPKKNAMTNGIDGAYSMPKSINVVEFEGGSLPIPNLPLEAKLRAEENSRMFAGRQIHPFFSSWRSGKKCQEVSEMEGNSCSDVRRGQTVILGPVHVFENTDDGEKCSLDWKNWTFNEETLSGTHFCRENTSSVLEGAKCSLTFDKFPSIFGHFCDKSIIENELSRSQCCSPKKLLQDTVAMNSAELPSAKGCEINQIGLILEHREGLAKLHLHHHAEQRMLSYYDGSRVHLPYTLWTNKDLPKRSTEVCGNSEAVKLLTEWLCLQHQTDYKNTMLLNGFDESRLQSDYYVLDQSDSDSECTERHVRLKNVLLVTGPIGVNASECRNGTLMK